MSAEQKRISYLTGRLLVERFCKANGFAAPPVEALEKSNRYYHLNACGFYNRGKIHIMVPKCANIGTAAMAWSFPGYIVDRTPYGVLAHELGHHIETRLPGIASILRERTGEKRITSYCPDDSEWFAEMFRLFVTNPLLLRAIRRKMFNELDERYPGRAETRDPLEVLRAAPNRTYLMAERRIAEGK